MVFRNHRGKRKRNPVLRGKQSCSLHGKSMFYLYLHSAPVQSLVTHSLGKASFSYHFIWRGISHAELHTRDPWRPGALKQAPSKWCDRFHQSVSIITCRHVSGHRSYGWDAELNNDLQLPMSAGHRWFWTQSRPMARPCTCYMCQHIHHFSRPH